MKSKTPTPTADIALPKREVTWKEIEERITRVKQQYGLKVNTELYMEESLKLCRDTAEHTLKQAMKDRVVDKDPQVPHTDCYEKSDHKCKPCELGFTTKKLLLKHRKL